MIRYPLIQPRPRWLRLFGFMLTATIAYALPASAEVYWRGNFETGDLTQWSYLLNPAGISLSSEHNAEGRYAAHVTIEGTPGYLWKNNPALNRVELQYRPEPKRNAEGSDLYFGWSFMLPELFALSRHEFGYWESAPGFHQIMRFNLSGESISFQMTAMQEPLWKSDAAIQANRWYDIAMHVHWSTDPAKGYVSVWFDGDSVVARAPARTLVAGDDRVFIQLGILRDVTDTVEEIYLDNALAASSIEDILTAQDDPLRTPATQNSSQGALNISSAPVR